MANLVSRLLRSGSPVTPQSEWLRAQIRSGRLDPTVYSAYTLEVYRLERAAEGLPHEVALCSEMVPQFPEAPASVRFVRPIGPVVR